MAYPSRAAAVHAFGLGAWDTLTPAERADVDRALAEGDARVNDHCGRRFVVETEDRTVVIRPDYASPDLLVGDFQRIESVTDGTTALTATQWAALAPAVAGHPHRWIRRLGGALWGDKITLVGRFEWDATPDNVVGAALLYARASYYTGVAKRGAEAVLPVNEVEGLLRPYKLPRI